MQAHWRGHRDRGRMIDIRVGGNTETPQQWKTCLYKLYTHDENDACGHVAAI